MQYVTHVLIGSCAIALFAVQPAFSIAGDGNLDSSGRPNVILIMADDK